MEYFTGLYSAFEETVHNSILQRNNKPLGAVTHSTSLLFNASVSQNFDGHPLFTFNRGACIAINDACMTLSTNSDFCKHLPFQDCDVLTIHNISPPERYVDYRYLISSDGKAIFPVTQILDCPDIDTSPRGRLGNHLSEVIIKLLALHEQGHFLQGHLHFLHYQTQEFYMYEIPEKPKKISPLDSQALELQADIFAIQFLLDNFINPEISKNLTPRGLWLDEAYEIEGWLLYSFLGVVILFSLLERADQKKHFSQNQRTHPTSAVRLLSAFDTFRYVFQKYIRNEEQQITLVNRILEESQVIFKTFECDPLSDIAFNEYFDPSIQKYQTTQANELNALSDRLLAIQEQLRPFADKAQKMLI